jgi:putative tryptophan/tyrosine transport system substrate-binding protein
MLNKWLVMMFGIVIISWHFAGGAVADKPYRIVTVQHQTFQPYTLSLKGFRQGIQLSEAADRITIDTFNADGDIAALDAFVASLKTRQDVDLIFAIGTHSTKRVVREIKNIPIVFTDLGAPETSGVISDWKGSGANYTGVETRDYVGIGIHLLHELMAFQRIGMIYLKGSPSHEGTIRKLTELSHEAGFEFFTEGFSLRDENKQMLPREEIRKNITAALEKVAPEVDVFYVQISNAFDQNFDLFFDCFKKYSLPSTGEPIYITKGLVIGIGRDKEKFGFQCAEYALKILDGADPGKLPMDAGRDFSISLNIEAATVVGYNPSIDILGAADQIFREIETTGQ